MTAFFMYALPLGFVMTLCCYMAYRAGHSAGATKQNNSEDIKDKDARVIEDRLRHNADYARRVRQRFTR